MPSRSLLLQCPTKGKSCLVLNCLILEFLFNIYNYKIGLKVHSIYLNFGEKKLNLDYLTLSFKKYLQIRFLAFWPFCLKQVCLPSCKPSLGRHWCPAWCQKERQVCPSKVSYQFEIFEDSNPKLQPASRYWGCQN